MKGYNRLIGDAPFECVVHGGGRLMALSVSAAPSDAVAPNPGALLQTSAAAERGTARPMPSVVLLVEENEIFALDATDIMRNIGVRTVMSTSNQRKALEIIASGRPDLVVLSVGLLLHESFDIADRLLELKIPFNFAVWYDEQGIIPARFEGIAILRKPYSEESLLTALTR